MTPITQTLFGGTDAPIEQIGNCYPSCVASILDLKLGDVPHIYQTHREDDDAAANEIIIFLRERGYVALFYNWADWIPRFLLGSLCIICGKSPRGDYDHAVVGEITSDGWRMIHDPHPSRDGIVGDPKSADFIFKSIRL